MKILITGASGLIGTHLTSYLFKLGHEVAHLGRKRSSNANILQFVWDIEKGTIDKDARNWADAIIHLAGASVADHKWTTKRKKEIIDSRVKSAKLLASLFLDDSKKPEVIVSASAVGFYGMITSEKIFTENDFPATDFFGDCCNQWEHSIDDFDRLGIRTVKLRIGVVLAKEAGALPKLAGPVKWFIGSPLGNGKQWMPWIHIDDLCELFLKGITDQKLSGSYNAVSSQHINNREFVKCIGKVLHRPVFFPPVPEFLLKMFLGEMAGIVTEGSRVSNEKLLKTGFVFEFDNLEKSLKNIFN